MNYNEYMANIKAYRNGTLMQAAPTDALSDWHEKYFDTAVSALSKKMIADHVEHSEDADKFGKDFVSLVAMLEEDGVGKQDIGKELEAVSKAAQSQADAAIKKIDSVQHGTDTLEGYQAAIRAYKDRLEHGEWKKHKYLRIENGRYIYPEDEKKNSSNSTNKFQSTLNAFKSVGQKIVGTVKDEKAKQEQAKEDKKAYDKVHKSETTSAVGAVSNLISAGKNAVNYYKNNSGGRTHDASVDAQAKAKAEAEKKQTEQDARKAAGEAMKAGRQATNEYKAQQEEQKKAEAKTYNEARKEGDARTEEYKKMVMEKQAAEAKKYANYNGTTKSPDASKARDAKIQEDNKEMTKKKETSNKSPKERLQSGESSADDIRKEIKDKSDAMKKEVEEMAKKYAGGGATVKATEFEPDTGAPQRFEIRDTRGQLVLDTGNFLLDYDEWNYTRPKKTVQHSDPRAAFYAAVDEYKSKKGLDQRVPL